MVVKLQHRSGRTSRSVHFRVESKGAPVVRVTWYVGGKAQVREVPRAQAAGLYRRYLKEGFTAK